MNTPLASAAPHPFIKGAYTVDDPMAPRGRPLFFASKERAEIAASKRNETRRNEND